MITRGRENRGFIYFKVYVDRLFLKSGKNYDFLAQRYEKRRFTISKKRYKTIK